MRAKKRSLTLKAFKMLSKGGARDGNQASPAQPICIPEAAALVASMMGSSTRHPQKDASMQESHA